MPIYEYRCDDCGVEFEAILLQNSPPAVCPSCASEQLTQQISASMVSSQGSRVRNYRGEEKKRDQQNTERARSSHHHQDHGHGHDHDHDH
jgi:putative FmdB family regulatory protein